MRMILKFATVVTVLCVASLAPGVAQEYAQPAANQLITLTAIGLAAQLCGVPMDDATKKKLADGLERLGNSQSDITPDAYHQKVQEMGRTITGDLEHACIQINNQDLPHLIDQILGQ